MGKVLQVAGAVVGAVGVVSLLGFLSWRRQAIETARHEIALMRSQLSSDNL